MNFLKLKPSLDQHIDDVLVMKTLNLTTVATLVITIASFLSNAVTGHYLIAGLEAFRGIGVLLFWLYTRRTKNIGVGVVGVIYVSWLGLTALMMASGGIGSLHLYWLIALPSFALMLVSRRLAVTLAAATLITVIGIVVYSGSGDLPSYAGPEGGRRGFSAILAMAVLMLISHMTLGWRDALAIALAKENAARQAEHLRKNRFFVHMNHEIRNPMNALVALTDLLQADDVSVMSRKLSDEELSRIEKRRADLIKSIRKTSDHIVSIVNDVLEIDSLDISTTADQQSLFSVRELGSDIYDITSARAVAVGSHTEITFKPGMNDLWVGNVPRIKQVLLNLVSNALQHSGSTEITVSFTESSDGIRFDVVDNGKGISNAALARMFDPYTSSEIGCGSSGLGVGICKLLVEKKMGGSISADSEVGRGTVFSVNIPLVRFESNEPIENISKFSDSDQSTFDPNSSELNGLCLLLIDDDDDCGQSMKMVLETYGLDVSLAKTSQEAIKITDSRTDIDVILVDHNLGPMSVHSGIELTKLLVGKGFNRVIGFTGNYSKLVHAQWKQAGVSSIIQKPTSARAVLGEISKLIEVGNDIHQS